MSATDPRLISWSVWKILGGSRPAGIPRAIPAEWWEFLGWAKWRMRGHPLPRPKGVPAAAPARWWPWKRDLEAALRLHHQPVPPAVGLAALARNVEFSAQEPELARELKRHQRVAWSADRGDGVTPGYPLSQALVDELRPRLAGLFSWCDCREVRADGSGGTPASYAIKMRDDYRLDGWIGQGETPAELRHACGINLDGSLMSLGEMRAEFGHGERARILVGNPTAWTAKQRARVIEWCQADQLAVIVECYANNAHPWPDAFDSQGVPVASWCLGVYDASGENPNAHGWWDPEDYHPHMTEVEWAHAGSYYLAGMHPGKIATLP